MGKRQVKINKEALRAEKTELVLKYLVTQQEVSKADKAKALERVKEIRNLLDDSTPKEFEEESDEQTPKRKPRIKRKKL